MCSACAGVSQEQELASTSRPSLTRPRSAKPLNSPKKSDTDQPIFMKKIEALMKKDDQINPQLSRESQGQGEPFVPEQGPRSDK
eukprot:2319007-Rhodomonas_salina.1